MPRIRLETFVRAPAGRCFNLSRSIDLHQLSTHQTGEQAVAGRTSGLIGLGETVTWRARHLGIRQHLTSRITAFDYPVYFEDRMVRGAFRSFQHAHHFRERDGGTLMEEIFTFESPFGLLGRLANHLFLTQYMTRLLQKRNEVIRDFAETEKWRSLPGLTPCNPLSSPF